MAIVESEWLIRHRLEFKLVKLGTLQARQVDSPSLPRCARELVLAMPLFYQYNSSRLVASLAQSLQKQFMNECKHIKIQQAKLYFSY